MKIRYFWLFKFLQVYLVISSIILLYFLQKLCKHEEPENRELNGKFRKFTEAAVDTSTLDIARTSPSNTDSTTIFPSSLMKVNPVFPSGKVNVIYPTYPKYSTSSGLLTLTSKRTEVFTTLEITSTTSLPLGTKNTLIKPAAHQPYYNNAFLPKENQSPSVSEAKRANPGSNFIRKQRHKVYDDREDQIEIYRCEKLKHFWNMSDVYQSVFAFRMIGIGIFAIHLCVILGQSILGVIGRVIQGVKRFHFMAAILGLILWGFIDFYIIYQYFTWDSKFRAALFSQSILMFMLLITDILTFRSSHYDEGYISTAQDENQLENDQKIKDQSDKEFQRS